MKIIDSQHPSNAPAPSALLHGVTGSGKSTFACKEGRPLVILTEAKAESMLRQINPNAVGLVPESLKDLDDLMVRLGQPEWLASKGVDRIVLDSFTELTYRLPQMMMDPNRERRIHKLDLQGFGDLKGYALAMVSAIQYTGLPSIIIARSVVKRVGLIEKVQPDSNGKSVDELPGKLLPTVEARWTEEAGFFIDSTPDEYSQRCGLPWLPPVFQGTAMEFLEIVQRGPDVRTAALTQQAETFTEIALNLQEAVQSQPKPADTPAVQMVMDGLDSKFITKEQWEDLEQAISEKKINRAQFKNYLIGKGWLKPEAQGLNTLLSEAWPMVQDNLTPAKLAAFKNHLAAKCATPHAA